MENHVSTERLLKVAASDDLLFTLEEFNHLKSCPDCFTEWAAFIESLPSDDRTQKAKRQKWEDGI